ncbi:unnamed protein product [Vitrella brassicaformis CCMP3155]|uniref:Major facilitator superfamily (MFS) profile domain-containing protein n=2 Tax=Vitrella brassicaformis TaxID=1169539 RepID=A0A0G4GJI5_VITBC|nr:unnamed protein product [Vitrella brassicaformis CCMP3155]|eukprot:CEM30078.1 unnamed protein product [Vitrella brassicaformis CCMP3155]
MAKDRSLATMVVVASWLVHFSTFGTRNTFGVFFPHLLAHFGTSRALTSVVFSAGSCMMLFGFINGALVRKYGQRRMAQAGAVIVLVGLVSSSFMTDLWQLSLTYGVIGGLGFGLSFMSAITILALHFDKNRAFATGLAVSGSGIGTLSLAPVFDALLVTLGWRNTFRVQAALCSGMILFASVFFERPSQESRTKEPCRPGGDDRPVSSQLQGGDARHEQTNDHLVVGVASEDDGSKGSTGSHGQRTTAATPKEREPACRMALSVFDWSLFRDSRLMLLAVAHFCWACAYLGTLPHWPNWGTENGLSSDLAALTVTAFGASSTASRIILGKVADLVGRIGTFFCCTVVMAVDVALLTVARGLWQLVLFACVFGIASGARFCLTPCVVAQLFGTKRLPVALGFLHMIIGVAGLVCGPVAGLIADKLSYPVAFGLLAVLGAVGSATFLLVWVKTSCGGAEQLDDIAAPALREASGGCGGCARGEERV